eukprot:5949736-Amphidinium_carterae.1
MSCPGKKWCVRTSCEAWVGLGNPGFFSDSQYMLVANPGMSESGQATVRVVPVAHDPRRPTVRESVVLNAPLEPSRRCQVAKYPQQMVL